MICDICKSRTAAVHIQKMSGGALANYYLCPECAERLGYGKRVNRFSDSAEPTAASRAGKKRCSCCGSTLNDIVMMGGPGCSECFTVFRAQIAEAIRKADGNVRYRGRVPTGSSPQARREAQLQQARTQLAQAIETQDFERAAVLRDLIRTLENGGSVQ